ncbi:MAG: hypothetical protein M1822_008046 [Bathelium mastoideum]|nr:MAG: hypothetical protein M1822_008046 [Bathelium mastoideum]
MQLPRILARVIGRRHLGPQRTPLRAPRQSCPDTTVQDKDTEDDLWIRAEQTLNKDEKKRKLLETSFRILSEELGSELDVSTSIERHQQLCQLINATNERLEAKKWKIRIGEHSFKAADMQKAFKNILLLKDLINSAAHSSPPAAIACASATVVLTVSRHRLYRLMRKDANVLQLLIQAQTQHDFLLRGLVTTSEAMCRLPVMEEIYRLGAADASASETFKSDFEKVLTRLYSQILEFQVRALCYLRKPSILQSFKDMLKRDAWDELLEDINKSEESVRRFTILINDAKMKRWFEKIGNKLEAQNVWQEAASRDKKVKNVFHILQQNTYPYAGRKERNREREPGTCEWFTNHPLFNSWDRDEGPGLLWVSADPGSGKSVLARYLVDQVLPSNSRRTVCYFFFKDDFEDQRNAANAICAILRQILIENSKLLRDTILDKFEIEGKVMTQSFRSLWDALRDIAADTDAGDIICVLDALDECKEDSRVQLIQAVCELYAVDSPKSNLRFLLTSRPYGNIQEEFLEIEDRWPSIHLNGENETESQKISREIDIVVKSRVRDIGRKKRLRPDEIYFLEEQLSTISSSHRTYLWVYLTLDVISKLPGFTRGNVQRAVHSIPQTVDDAYNKILNRSTDAEKAYKLLQIVTAARRPLSVKEMSWMMAIEEAHKSYDDLERELEPEDRFIVTVRDLCGLFVIIVDGKIYLLHQTAKEFLVRNDFPKNSNHYNNNTSPFDWKHSLQPTTSNKVLSERCIWYLTSSLVHAGYTALLNYSAHSWIVHLREAGTKSEDPITILARNLCESGSEEYKSWFQEYRQEHQYDAPSLDDCLSVASFFALETVVKLLLSTANIEVNSMNKDGRTPLSWAAERGHEGIIQLLLQRSQVDVNSMDKYGQTPLGWAARRGHQSIVQLLLKTGQVDVNSMDKYGQTPLGWAARRGHQSIVQLLLEMGRVNINLKDKDGQTPLVWAIRRGDQGIIQLLLETGRVNINLKDKDGQTPLVWAIKRGRQSIVQLLLKTGQVNVNSKDEDGQTPLVWATKRGHQGIIQLLLKTGQVDVNSMDKCGQTPLGWAASYGRQGIIQLLLETGQVNIDSKDEHG